MNAGSVSLLALLTVGRSLWGPSRALWGRSSLPGPTHSMPGAPPMTTADVPRHGPVCSGGRVTPSESHLQSRLLEKARRGQGCGSRPLCSCWAQPGPGQATARCQEHSLGPEHCAFQDRVARSASVPGAPRRAAGVGVRGTPRAPPPTAPRAAASQSCLPLEQAGSARGDPDPSGHL